MSQSDCQFAVEDKSTDQAARVNVSRNGHAMKEPFSLTSILRKKNRQWLRVVCTPMDNEIRHHSSGQLSNC